MCVQTGTNPVPAGPDPIRQLVGFDRVYLGPGQQTQVTFNVDASGVSRVGDDGVRVSVAGVWTFSTADGEPLAVTVA